MGMHVRYLKWNVGNLNQSRSALTQLLVFLFDVNVHHTVSCCGVAIFSSIFNFER